MDVVLNLTTPQLNGEAIRQIRDGLGWSRDYLSKRLFVACNTIYLWEKGIRKISLKNQDKLMAIATGVDKINQEHKEKEQ